MVGAVVRLNSKADSPRPLYQHEVQLGARVGRPEVALVSPRPRQAEDVLEEKAFPRRAVLWMAVQVPRCIDAEERSSANAEGCLFHAQSRG
jgi:hypothetical protein